MPDVFLTDKDRISIRGGVTPEIFGAAGDGKTNDTDAVLETVVYAKEYKLPLILDKRYLISSPITIDYDNAVVQCLGEIIYDGTSYAVILDSCCNCDIHIRRITAVNKSGLLIHANSGKMCAYNNVTVGEVTAADIGIHDFAEGGTQYNEIRFNKINANICIDIQATPSAWNTETKWYGGHMGGVSDSKHATYAIRALNDGGGNVTTHRFYNVGFEGVIDGCVLENVKFFVFDYPRTSESIDNKVFILKKFVQGCVFNLSHCMMRWIDYSGNSGTNDGYNADNNIFEGIFMTNGGVPYKFTRFEICAGRMFNCNQKRIGYRNIYNSEDGILTLDPSKYYEEFSQELLLTSNDCVLDTKYYHSGNINIIYAAMSGDSTATGRIIDSDGNVIAKVSDYPWKKLRLTAVAFPTSTLGLAPNGWIIEVLE